jgi:predicted metal-dependent peptidase
MTVKTSSAIKSMGKSDALELIQRARLELLFKHTIWGVLALSLEIVEITDDETKKRIWRGQKPTMATDGKRVYFCADFIRTLTFAELCGVIAHEAGHYGLLHCLRLNGRNAMAFNYVTDAVLNQMLIDDGLTLPSDALFLQSMGKILDLKRLPQVNGYIDYVEIARTHNAETLYDMLLRDGDGEGEGDGGGGGGQMPEWGVIIEPTDGNGNALSDEAKEVLEHETRSNLQNAAERARAQTQGNVPKGFEELLDIMNRSKVDWRPLLRDFITNSRPTRYSYKKINRRYKKPPYIFPAIIKKNFGTIVWFTDTSGSMGDTLTQALAELNEISREIEYDEIIIVPIDCDVHEAGIQRFKHGEVITCMRTDGRGGTSFIPAFDWLDKQEDIMPTRVIYFTDMYGSFPEEEYKVPTLWLSITPKLEAPWGKTVYVDPEG